MADSKTKTAHVPGTVKMIENKAEFEDMLKTNKMVVVDFYADWCGPCRAIAPFLKELAATHTDIFFCKVDVDESSDIAEDCGIKAMPTFLFYKNGEKATELTGANKDKLIELVLALK